MAKTENPTKPTVYAEVDTGDVIGSVLWNLHVQITQDGDCWFAQGYEIDYAADGSSLDDVQLRFQCGLSATIHEHINIFGTAEKVLSPAPAEVWQGLKEAPGSSHTYSHIGVYKFDDPSVMASLPFSAIEYFTVPALGAA